MNDVFMFDPFMELRATHITDENRLLSNSCKGSFWSALKRFFFGK